MRTPYIHASSPMLTTAVTRAHRYRQLRELAQAQQMLDAQQEAGTADPADQNRDLHTDRH